MPRVLKSGINLVEIVTTGADGMRTVVHLTEKSLRSGKLAKVLFETVEDKIIFPKISKALVQNPGAAGYGLFMWAMSEYAVERFKADNFTAYVSKDGVPDHIQIVTGSLAQSTKVSNEGLAFQIRHMKGSGESAFSASASSFLSLYISPKETRHERASGAEATLRGSGARVFNTETSVAYYGGSNFEGMEDSLTNYKPELIALMEEAIQTYVFTANGINPGGWANAIRHIESLTMALRKQTEIKIQLSVMNRVMEAEAEKAGKEGR